MKYLIILLSMGLTLSSCAQSTGKISYQGLEFTIPSGWQGSETAEGYLIQKDGTTHYIVVQPAAFENLYKIEQELNADLSEQPGVSLSRSSAIENISNSALGAPFSLIGGDQPFFMYVAAATNNEGRGAIVMAGDQTGVQYAGYEQACKNLVTTIKFKEIEVRNGGLNASEKQYADCRLTYMESYYSGGYGDVYGAYRQKITIDLCSKGYFKYSDDFEIGGGGDASAFNGTDGNAGNGNWSIRNQNGVKLLVLEFFNGQSYEYQLEKNSEGHTYLNGKRYYVSNQYDEAEYRPECF